MLSSIQANHKEGQKFYWSYDGHYFYTESLEGFRAMIRDYKDGVHTNAVNVGSPYYNYYQFLIYCNISIIMVFYKKDLK